MKAATLILAGVMLGLGACANASYEAPPVSGEQWLRRQERIEREAARREAENNRAPQTRTGDQ